MADSKRKNPDHFGEAMPDGCLTVPSDGKTYRLREAIKHSEELGMPLTEEEMEQFEKRRKSVERAMAIMTTSTNGPDERFMEAVELYVDGKITLEEMEVKVDGLEYLGE